jgi:hypothetical protein
MQNLYQAAAWAQVISLFVAVIALVVPVSLYYLTKRRKALGVQCHPIVFPIEVKAGEALKGDIGITYRGQTIQNLFLVQATLKNIGNQAIPRSDVVEPVRFAFGPGTELLREPQVVHRQPENLQIGWSWSAEEADTKPNAVELTFDLLNQEDELTAEFICTGKGTIPKVTARIRDVRKIEVIDRERMRLRKEWMAELWKVTLLIVGISICILLLSRLILAQVDAILDTINPFLARLADDSSFRSGCLWGLFIALLIGLVSRQLLYWWNRVLLLFSDYRKARSQPGLQPL